MPVEFQEPAHIVNMLNEMIEEAQREANACVIDRDFLVLIAKRDAITEVKMRLRDGRYNPQWARMTNNV